MNQVATIVFQFVIIWMNHTSKHILEYVSIYELEILVKLILCSQHNEEYEIDLDYYSYISIKSTANQPKL